MAKLDTQKRQLCDIQGRLFELALKGGYDCPAFIESFMNSRAAALTYSREVMYWAGYVYRYWHYYTGEYSRDIYQIANAGTMSECWLGFHTLDVEMAIDDLKEICAAFHFGPLINNPSARSPIFIIYSIDIRAEWMFYLILSANRDIKASFVPSLNPFLSRASVILPFKNRMIRFLVSI